MNLKYLYTGFIILIGANNTTAQTFMRVIDPLNPVTTDQSNSGGGSWVDINNDGFLDLFVSNGNLSNQNNSLYMNLQNGNFIHVTTGDLVNDGGSSIGSTWGDYDQDGFLDCFVTNRNNFGNFLYHGNGDTIFTKILSGNLVTDIANSNSSSWVDVNSDGILDLYVVNFQGADYFYLGDGSPGYTFTSQTGINTGTQFSIPGAWADQNNDLLPDLFIGNSGTQNDLLYLNNGNLAFSQTTFSDAKATLGASWADYDNDGDLDLFVANYLNEASILYQNSGAPLYTLTPLAGSAVSITGNSVGSAWGDVDNDGDLDLFVCDDGGNNHLFLNDGFPNYTFTAVTSGAVVTDGGNSFGGVFGDYDNDGQLDLFVANQLNQQNFLYHNDGNSNHWITVKCEGTTANKSGIGAKIFVKATIAGNSVWQMQEVEGQTGYNSQNLWLHVGLGDATVIDSLLIKWPSGNMDSSFQVSVDQSYNAIEGIGLTTGIPAPGNASLSATLFQNYPNPFHGQTTIRYQLPSAATVLLQVFDITGSMIKLLVNEKQSSGIHELKLNANEFSSGCYYYQLITDQSVHTKKIIKE